MVKLLQSLSDQKVCVVPVAGTRFLGSFFTADKQVSANKQDSLLSKAANATSAAAASVVDTVKGAAASLTGPEEASNTGAAPASAVQDSPQDKAWAKQKAEELKRELAEAEADRVVEYDVKAHKQ
ncbi:hypothetical protein N2152v2_000468 [Parachlorella kessleri]